MEIWLDTANLESISEAESLGVLAGVTTNPTIVAKSSMPIEKLLEKILLRQKGPVTAQVTADQSTQMVTQAKDLFRLSNRIIIKVPVTREGLKAIYLLSQEKIPVMATAIFDTNQVLLSARAGASYIAPYYSRICEAEIDGILAMKEMLKMLHRYQFPAKLIAASLKTPEQVKECAEMGCHAVTLNEKVFAKLIENHPSTMEAINLS